jgi:hypothetical protein
MRTSSSDVRTKARLKLPFAIVGLAGGWLSVGLLANPLVRIIPARNQTAAAVLGAFAGVLLGALLERKVADRGAWGDRPLTLLQLAVLVIAGGAFTGGGVGLVEVGSMWAVLTGALNGGLASIAFVPVCALVFAAALRADRARHGSIVASADRRAVHGILAGALSVTTLAGALDATASRYAKLGALPHAGAAMAIAAALVVAGVLLADVRAFARVARLAACDLEQRDPSEARDAATVPAIDLGLGDDVRARLGKVATAYRSRARPVAMLMGSVASARAALGRALLRDAAALLVTVVVLAGHRWAETPDALLAYLEQECDHSTRACYDAGLLLAPERASVGSCPEAPKLGGVSVEPDVARSLALLRRSCEGTYRCACDALWQTHRGALSFPGWYNP